MAGTGWFVVIKSRKIWLKDNQNYLSRPSNWHLVDTRLDMSGSIVHNHTDYNTTSHYYTQPVGPIRHWLYINTFVKKESDRDIFNFFYFLNMSCSHFLGNLQIIFFINNIYYRNRYYSKLPCLKYVFHSHYWRYNLKFHIMKLLFLQGLFTAVKLIVIYLYIY